MHFNVYTLLRSGDRNIVQMRSTYPAEFEILDVKYIHTVVFAIFVKLFIFILILLTICLRTPCKLKL